MNSLILDLAGRFSAAGLTWAYGGSLTLSRHGIDVRVNDLDLFVEPNDFAAATAILETMGQPVNVMAHPRFQSQKYQKYIIKGIEVDVMAGLMIMTAAGAYVYPFDKASITKRDVFARGSVNYTSVEDWYVLYLLLDRHEDKEKIKAIVEYLHINGVVHKALLKRTLAEAPAMIKDTVRQSLGAMI